MQIVCPACSESLQLADEKIPTGRRVRLTCPACRERFVFEPPDNHKAASADDGTKRLKHLGSDTSPNSSSTPRPASLSALDFDITDVGPAPRALLCLDRIEHREACQSMLLALGYNTIHIPSQQAQALLYMTQVRYEFCVLDATFDGSVLEANPVLACLVELPMDRRRYMFAMLCSPEIMTGDGMSAYSHSVNLVVNYVDVQSCRRIVEQHLAEHKHLYRVYREMLQQMGREA